MYDTLTLNKWCLVCEALPGTVEDILATMSFVRVSYKSTLAPLPSLMPAEGPDNTRTYYVHV